MKRDVTRQAGWRLGERISSWTSRLLPGSGKSQASAAPVLHPRPSATPSTDVPQPDANRDLAVSHAPQIMDNPDEAGAFKGWHEPSVAAWQNSAYRELLDQMHRGDARLDLQVAADAIRDTGVERPAVLEVGCGSGYYREVLAHLVGDRVAYTGLDYSQAMISLAQSQYPEGRFVVGDATSMQFGDGVFDIVMNGAALMHMPDYEKAIAEGRRVARTWCIYHTVPMVLQRETTILHKHAYGAPVFEITFNQSHFEAILERNGLRVHKIYENISHDYLSEAMGEPVHAYTYLCEVRTSA